MENGRKGLHIILSEPTEDAGEKEKEDQKDM